MQVQSIGSCVSIEYEKKLGGFRPHFEGKPDSYYELSAFDITSGISLCFFIVAGLFFLCVGLYFWSANVSTQNLVLVWSIILCVFVPSFMMMAYCGSRGKIQIEEQLVKDALEKLVQEKEERENLRGNNDKYDGKKQQKKTENDRSTEKLLIQDSQ